MHQIIIHNLGFLFKSIKNKKKKSTFNYAYFLSVISQLPIYKLSEIEILKFTIIKFLRGS